MVKLPVLTHPRSAVAALAGVALFAIANLDLDDDVGSDSTNHYSQYVRSKSKATKPRFNLNAPYAPYKGEIEPRSSRRLATYNETDGTCETEAVLGPDEIPDGAAFQNTIVVGFPGADKRTVLRQMEMMTKLSGRDAWDFQFLGMTPQPFIKTNYPHHEGTWGFGDHADQVVYIVRNIRWCIDSYHDVLADLHYAKTWVEATEMIPNLYNGEILDEKYVRWRDERIMDEIGWYGWHIDYWMEGGILRDYFDHRLTTVEHWAKLREPETYTYGELQWDVNVCATDVANLPNVTYDEKCDPAYTADCRPKAVISAERLMDPNTGREENRKIGALLNRTAGVNETLLEEAGWDCMYDLLIGDNPDGVPPPITVDYHDYRWRDGVQTRKHLVSTRHLDKMVQQLTRLINKYSAYDPETGIDWTASEQAAYLVELLTEHRAEIQLELDGTSADQVWPHPPKPNWVVFPLCGNESRRVWDYDYPHGSSGLVMDMWPDLA